MQIKVDSVSSLREAINPDLFANFVDDLGIDTEKLDRVQLAARFVEVLYEGIGYVDEGGLNRLPSETLESGEGNCVDQAVLAASVLKAQEYRVRLRGVERGEGLGRHLFTEVGLEGGLLDIYDSLANYYAASELNQIADGAHTVGCNSVKMVVIDCNVESTNPLQSNTSA